ncbi:nuclear transport factor 2 family protein [Vagococcus sp. DIV0080]|uniref:Nuclear transport factor 2 family protein n=2 Tax=Candidatus Vagococcus giribetii TaxID=2230876 RepID=A0ABS3HUI9_9ENTE|nr:nuclear transport factor 2 family protein [Vagococcus sp. DIV0080]
MRKSIDEVKQVIDQYRTSVFSGDEKLLRKVFHPNAQMNGYMNSQLVLGTPELFFEEIGSKPAMKEPFKATITYLKVTGRIANVVLYATGFYGDGVVEDHFQLLKGPNGHWKIISKCFITL